MLATAWQIALQTAGYLVAYAFVLVLAPLAHLGLVALGTARGQWIGRIGRTGAPVGVLAAAVVGVTTPLSRSAIEAGLARVGGARGAVAFLAGSHALNAYYWALLGPLLGKDFLLSHLVGVILFVLVSNALVRRFGPGLPPAAADRPPPGGGAGGLASLLAASALRYAGLAALGLGLGGLVAGWGFSPRAWAPAEMGAGGAGTQLVNGVLGVALALCGVPPLSNLFVGTYLWKVGLAHAGIVAFFCAAPAAPTRWPLYARRFGRRGAVRFVATLGLASLLAGLVTAWLFGAADVAIRYKLIPEQLWRVG